jgi:hypothetical protein
MYQHSAEARNIMALKKAGADITMGTAKFLK